jgi:uncharacterized protein YqgC (DUF456 family)
MIGEILLIILAFVLVISSIAGAILPFLPGVPMAWVGMLIFAYATQFAEITWTVLLVFLGLTLFTIVTDIVAPLVGAKTYRASWHGIAGASLGLLLGVLLLGPLGVLAGPFLGAVFGEMWHGKTSDQAVRAARGTIIGYVAGSAIKLAVVVTMLGFLIMALF